MRFDAGHVAMVRRNVNRMLRCIVIFEQGLPLALPPARSQ
jgi:hypothetical protein